MNPLLSSGAFFALLGLAARWLALRFSLDAAGSFANGSLWAGLLLMALSSFADPRREKSAGPARAKTDPLDAIMPIGFQASFAPPAAPGWMLIPAGAAAGLGMLILMMASDGNTPVMRLGVSIFFGGLSFMAGSYLAYASAAARRNFWRAFVALGGFLLVVGAIFTGVLIAAGGIEGPGVPYYGGLGILALIGGLGAAYYGLKFQQSSEGLAIGKALGFADADGQVSGDGEYDSKGMSNGLETLLDVEQRPGGRNSSPSFVFKVLCRCGNSRGLALSVRRSGLLSVLPSSDGLQPVEGLSYWGGYSLRASQPELAAGLLAEARRPGDVFNAAAGFSELTLKDGDMEFTFAGDGYIELDYAKRVVGEASLFASKFR